MGSLEELKKRGSGIHLDFVDNGTVSESFTVYSYENPNDLINTKDALREVMRLAKFEVIFKQEQREKLKK